MQMHPLRLRILAIAAGVAVLAATGLASADPPSRVARLGYTSGTVSFSPAGEDDWVQATVNRPLTTGDRLWADRGSRAEIQVGGAMIRMNAGTSVAVLNLDDRITQLQLTQGTLNIRVRRLDPNQLLEIDTPNLAFTLRQPGEYRIAVDPDGNATDVVVRKGQGEVYGEGASYVVDSRQPYRFTGTGLRDYQYVDAPRLDDFDRWSGERDRGYDNSVSARYVSQDVVGYQDLDAHGTWRSNPQYGSVWVPTRVAAGWAPYRDGHWAWVDPWGWTWVDDAPWGFAVSHYGRWTNFGGTWGWVPGPVSTRAYYAPALVAFVGGSNFQIAISSGNVGGVAWFPLGPREVYRPSYPVSRGYFENVNRSNTVITNTVINNYYNNTNVTNVVYANRQVPGAVVAVPAAAFVQSQQVARVAVPVTREIVASAPLAVNAPVAPTERSVRGAAGSSEKPPARAFDRPVVARTAPPAAPVGFAAQQQHLAAKPGQPLDDATRRQLKPVAAAPAPVVNVVAQSQDAAPTLRPPPAAPGAKPGNGRVTSGEGKAPATPATAVVPGGATQGLAPSQAAPPVAVARPPEPRDKPDLRGNREQRAQPAASPPGAAMPPVAPPQVAPPVAAVQPPESRGKPEQTGRRAPPPSAPPQAAAAPQGTQPPSIAPPAPVVQAPEPRGRPEQRGKPAMPPQDSAMRQPAPTQAAPPAPAPVVQAPEPRGRSEQRGNGEQRGQPAAPPPQQRAAVLAPVQTAVPASAPQPPPQRSAQSAAAPPPQAGQPAAAAPPTPPPAKPGPGPAARQVEPRPAVAASKPPIPQSQPAPRGDAPSPDSKAAAGTSGGKKKDSDAQKREEEESRKQKG